MKRWCAVSKAASDQQDEIAVPCSAIQACGRGRAGERMALQRVA
jgi:hypothetical protein